MSSTSPSAAPTPSASPFLTVPEVAALLRVPEGTIWLYCRAGKLPAIKVGRSWRIPAQALADLQARAWDRAEVSL